MINIISSVNYLISVDQKTQLRHRQLQDVGAVGLHHEVICYKIPSNAQVPLKLCDVLQGLSSQTLLYRLVRNILLLLSIDNDCKLLLIAQQESDV